MKEIFLLLLLMDVIFALSPVINDPRINEIYLKPSYSDMENEEFVEILLPVVNPSPTYLYGFGMIIIDHFFILDYIDFSSMEIKTGKDDIVNDKGLVVISNNETTANVHFFSPQLNLRAASVHALILVKKPTMATDLNKLELKQKTSTSSFLQLTGSAPLTNGNKEVLRRLLVDVVVYRKSHNDDDVNIWIQSIEPRWSGKSNLLPTGSDDILDKVSLARCDKAHLSGLSFKHDKPTPGTKNLCANVGEDESMTRAPAGLALLQSRRTSNAEPETTEPSDTTPMEALPENYVSKWLDDLTTHGMNTKQIDEFFTKSTSRKFYSFLPDATDFKQSSVRCELCYRTHKDPASHIHLERTQAQLPAIMKTEGLKFQKHARNTWQKIREHEEFPFHVKALERAKQPKLQEKDIYAEIPPDEELAVTADKISLVYLEVKVGLSIRAHEVLSEGLLHLGFPIGESLNGRKAAHDIIHFLGTKIHNNLIQRLIKSDVEFSLMLDASTDIGLVHTLLVYIRYTEDGMPVIKVFALIEAHDSTANGMWNVVEKAIEAEGREFVSYFKRRCVALGSDGASSMTGRYNSFKTKMSAYIMTGERAGRPLQHYHCANHKLALAYNDVMFSNNPSLGFCKTMTDHCNDLARFYSSKSYKRRDEMLSESKQLQESIRSFQRIQKVRWVPATQTSYEVVIQNYRTFMSHLSKVTRDQTYPYPPEARQTAFKLLKTFSDKNFISTLHLHLDVIQELSKWAKILEKKESTVIDIEAWFTKVQNAFESMKQTPGPNLEQFLSNCKCGLTACGTLNMYEQSSIVTWKDTTLSNNGTSRIPKLSETRVLLLSSLLTSFQERFPPTAISAFSVLQPSFLHMRSDTQWHNLAIYLNQYYGYPTLISTQLISLKNRIIASDFHRDFIEDPPEIYWPNALANSDFHWTPDLKRIIRIALVQPSSTAQVESGFSLVVAIKTQYRSRLSTPIVQDTLQLKFNGPSVAYLPKYRLAKDWVNAHHLKADSIKRHKSQKMLKRSEYSETMRF